jgi:hypothetical protein
MVENTGTITETTQKSFMEEDLKRIRMKVDRKKVALKTNTTLLNHQSFRKQFR